MLVEYLYFDEARLDSYIEQFASPEHVKRYASWKLGGDLTGIRGEVSSAPHIRSMTKHEKVEAFTKFVVDNDLIAGHCSDFEYPLAPRPFADFTVDARRFFIPGPKVAVWVSKPPAPTKSRKSNDGMTFLIEDSQGKDSEPYHRYSSYSALWLLADELNRTGRDIRNLAHDFDEDEQPAHSSIVFAEDPFGFLEKVGAQAGPISRVRAIFKYRASSTDISSSRGHTPTTVGYPIFIERVESPV